ncbi:hypothetical protein LEMLEM_LOCUS12991, partial [Lemmus lemmus]
MSVGSSVPSSKGAHGRKEGVVCMSVGSSVPSSKGDYNHGLKATSSLEGTLPLCTVTGKTPSYERN